jgi:hypothetical protein
VQLFSEGSVYDGSYNTLGKTITVNVGGEPYTGNYVMGQTFNFGASQSYGSAYSGRSSAYGYGTSFGQSVSTSNQGRALLVSPSNKTIRCDIMASGMNGQGVCQDGAGRMYDLRATLN